MSYPVTTTAEVKAPTKSKTNITAAITALFGILVALGVVPEGNEGLVGTIVAAASGLIIWFRTKTNAVLKT